MCLYYKENGKAPYCTRECDGCVLDSRYERRCSSENVKHFEVTLTVKVEVDVEDPEATENTIAFMVEEDLRDAGWDADVKVSE